MVLYADKGSDGIEVVFCELVGVLAFILEHDKAEAVEVLAVADDVDVLLIRYLYGCEKPWEHRAAAHWDYENGPGQGLYDVVSFLHRGNIRKMWGKGKWPEE